MIGSATQKNINQLGFLKLLTMVWAQISTSPILIPSPVQCSPLVVGRCSRSGLYCANNELLVKSAPKPPATKGTKQNEDAVDMSKTIERS